MLKIWEFWAFFFLLTCVSADVNQTLFDDLFSRIASEDYSIFQDLDKGKMSGFYTFEEFAFFHQKMKEKYPDYFSEIIPVGKTFLGKDLPGLYMTKNISDSAPKHIIGFTSLHHSREPMGLNMLMALISSLMARRNDQIVNHVLSNTHIWFIPVVNYDRFLQINEAFGTSSWETVKWGRKNMHAYSKCNDQADEGVDLNRNYGYKFAFDSIGSSNDKCGEDYRGPEAFSEPETQSIRDFVESHANIMIWINLHAFGNAEDTINYLANGEATDWMYGEKGIIAMSPELGADSTEGNKFYPPQRAIKSILETDFYILDYWVNKMAGNISLVNQSIYEVFGDQVSSQEAHFVLLSNSMNKMTADFELQEAFTNSQGNKIKRLMITEIEYDQFKEGKFIKENLVYIETGFVNSGNGKYTFSVSIGPRKFYSLIAVYQEHFTKDVGTLNFSLKANNSGLSILSQAKAVSAFKVSVFEVKATEEPIPDPIAIDKENNTQKENEVEQNQPKPHEIVIDREGLEKDAEGAHAFILYITIVCFLAILIGGLMMFLRYLRHLKNEKIQRQVEMMIDLERELNKEQV